MIGYKLTDNQKNFIHAKQYAPYQFINCVQDINGIWFTFFTDEDKAIIATTDIAWILECEQMEYIPPISINPFDN
jgi:hypothetical protein